MGNFKYLLSKFLGHNIQRFFPTFISGGKSFPGLLFIKLAGFDSIRDLSDHQLDIGGIIITGTNGKTTTTSMIINLLSKDNDTVYNVENNTVYALTTALLTKKTQLGIFEYGIRDIKHGRPADIQRWINPIGVIYTNISREHTQVAGVKNPFDEYVKAKTLLSQNMDHGVIIVNSDDPRTANIGINKEDDCHITYYGLEIEHLGIFDEESVTCPKCGNELKYTKRYMNHRGVYSCDCGFRRPDPDVKITNYEQISGKWHVTIDADTYNYNIKDNIQLNTTIEVPLFGLHNLYNVLCSIATYLTFTTKIDTIETTIQEFFNNLTMEFLPPGRFELINIDGKLVGVGQGDNGDATKVNVQYMSQFIDDKLEFIYTTPDLNEDEIFEDHLSVMKASKPDSIQVLPGRVSVEASKNYYEIIKNEFDNTNYHAIEWDFEKRTDEIIKLVQESDYKYVLITGCGDEQKFWNLLTNKLKNL